MGDEGVVLACCVYTLCMVCMLCVLCVCRVLRVMTVLCCVCVACVECWRWFEDGKANVRMRGRFWGILKAALPATDPRTTL